MINELNNTPNSLRLHIGIFGRANAGKSSILNFITGSHNAIVSDTLGTTTDPVYKAMELIPIGPCVFIDTAGFDDNTKLGRIRIEKTLEVLPKCHIALLVFTKDSDLSLEKEWTRKLTENNVKVLGVLNKETTANISKYEEELGIKVIMTDTILNIGLTNLKNEIIKIAPLDLETVSTVSHIINSFDKVLLVMPQDKAAPKGRLILPQVRILRDLIDINAVTTCCNLKSLNSALKDTYDYVICDSQVFKEVYDVLPKGIPLTSFSLLMSNVKGDLKTFIKNTQVIDKLKDHSKILICESCTHNAVENDIATQKLPKLLKKYTQKELDFTFNIGKDFINPENYDLVIHCGGCMFTRKEMLTRILKCEKLGVPITNFGAALAKLNGILDKVSY